LLSTILRSIAPREYVRSVYDVDLAALRERGVTGLVIDLDNTITRWDAPEPTDALATWFAAITRAGMRACILSNNFEARVRAFADSLGVPAIHRASKPKRRAFRRAMDEIGTSPGETAVIGDQLFTDVWGANRLGLYTVLVRPMSRREFAGTRLVRIVERLALRLLSRRGLIRLESANPCRSGDTADVNQSLTERR